MSVKLRERKLKGGAKGYHLAIYHNGKYHYEFLNIHGAKQDTKEMREQKAELAALIRSQREIELISKGEDYTPKHKKNTDFLAFYEDYLQKYSKGDMRMIKGSLAWFKKYLSNGEKEHKEIKIKCSDITTNRCEDFRAYLLDSSGLTGETPHNYFARFKKVVKKAYKEGLLKDDPLSKLESVKKESNTVRKQILTEEELRLLAAASCGNDEVRRAFLFACNTGLGLAEIKELTWLNIRDGRLITKRQKTNKEVNILLSSDALKLLGKRGRPGEEIFKIHISDTSVNKDLQKWAERAAIDKKITFYCGRHTFAVRLLKNKANLKTVADAMGHANHNHTVKYLNYVDDLKDEATGGLNSIL
jgi:site-specific recombinase XerD